MELYEIEPGTMARKTQNGKDKILWLHGYTLDSSSWEEMWSLLPEYEHIGIDLPSHGHSASIVDGHTLLDLGQTIANICQKNDIKHLVALSFGTMIGLQVGLTVPNYFKSITLGAPAIAGGPQDKEMQQVYARLMMFAMIYKKTNPLFSKFWLSSPAWKGIEKNPNIENKLREIVQQHRWEELCSYTKNKQFTYPPQSIQDIQKISSPVLILIGDREMDAFKQCAKILQENLAHCESHVLENTDHLCMLQHPQESATIMRKYWEML